jgi:hypothetical protein
VAIRPSTFIDGPVGEYYVGEKILYRHSMTQPVGRSNVAHFACELACDEEVFRKWKGKYPIVVNE